MSVNCVSDVINRIQRMQDEVDEMSVTMNTMREDYEMDNPRADKDHDDYDYCLWKAWVELDALSSAMTEALDQLQQVRYA